MQNERSRKIWAEARREVEQLIGTDECPNCHEEASDCGVCDRTHQSLVLALVKARRDALFQVAEGFSGEQELWTGTEIREHLHMLAELIDVQN